MLLDGLLGVAGKLIDKLIPDPTAKAQAQIELARMAQEGELAKMANETNLYKAEQDNVSNRWIADMGSDSWLSKNIRPLSLIAIFTGYFMFAMMSAFGYNANEAYVQLLGNWGMLVFGAYFGSRSLEKITEIRNRK
ncbi:Holin of 3TMs, for gene-transfer release [uncultured Caudovirales phage]|uniref:Holin of 3TMs, for gene-transfer release n=1 Tax=uncultured Caudovirales phage TaxID=2100421 RepID=A0A6J7WY14_9CAUD|nr:Holin of 3TMs, for gene-transfer release [uncultured Caudovirales phage]